MNATSSLIEVVTGLLGPNFKVGGLFNIHIIIRPQPKSWGNIELGFLSVRLFFSLPMLSCMG